MKKGLLLFLAIFMFNVSYAQVKITNEMIYEKLIQIEKNQAIFGEKFKQIDKRFEMIDKRFEDMNKRFEDINKRFEELREDMNKRFEQMMNFLWMITGIFTTLTLGVIGFAYWDRRTIIRKAKEETIEQLEREGKLKNLIDALKELAKEDKKLAQILRQYNLL